LLINTPPLASALIGCRAIEASCPYSDARAEDFRFTLALSNKVHELIDPQVVLNNEVLPRGSITAVFKFNQARE